MNEYVAFILYRPEDPVDSHYEVVKLARYLGYPVMAERQVESTEVHFIEKGMIPFLLKGSDGIWGIWTTPKVIENGVQKLVTKFSPPKTENGWVQGTSQGADVDVGLWNVCVGSNCYDVCDSSDLCPKER